MDGRKEVITLQLFGFASDAATQEAVRKRKALC